MNDIATEALNKIFSILAIVSISISAIILITYLFSKLFSVKLSIISNFNKLIYDNSVVFSWAIATLATFGSLFYSEVSGFILMYYQFSLEYFHFIRLNHYLLEVIFKQH